MDSLATNWLAVGLRGIAALAFGLFALLLPHLTLVALVLLFAAWVIVDGVAAMVSGLGGTNGDRNWLLVLEGAFGVAAGIVALVWPGIGAIVLVYVIATWAIATGVIAIAAAWRLRSGLRHERIVALEGALSILLGAALVAFPAAGALAIVWLVAAYAVASGISLLALAVRLREHAERWPVAM